MASSSSASTSHGNNDPYVFDVFINHRGPDVKTTLASYLYNHLTQHCLRVFLDKPELEKGESIDPQIQSAIRTATVQIAIFSPGYADSKWCLEELVWMVDSWSKSRSTIIPIFYGVKPGELRSAKGGKGVYGRALSELRKKKTYNGQPRYEPCVIEEWGDALSKVADIIGFDQDTYKGVKTGVLQCFEAVLQLCNLPLVWSANELLEDVVEEVLKKVQRRLDVSQYPRGLGERLEDLETIVSLDQKSGKAGVIGIVGLGGIGKTTLAKEFFNSRRSNYRRSSFLFDIKDGSLPTLQSKLLKDLIQWKEQISSTHEGKENLRRYLSSSHALIILDDVDSNEQLEALLLPVKDVLNTGSLILVTSRNKDVLISSGIPESSMYSLTGLNSQHSRELFCLHAFGQSHPAVGFDKVVEKFSSACQGLPLSLKVLGALLYGKEDLNHWEAQFRKISKILPADIQSKLKISYNGLDEEEKQMFLDISCFFIGEKKDTVIRIWEGCGWEGSLGFGKLVDRCLVEVDTNCITMHDHLRDLGRDLAEKEPPRRELRLWRPTHNLVHELSGESPVRGISMLHGNDPQQSFENLTELARSRLSTNMNRLQLLRAKGSFVEHLQSDGQLPLPIYLRWEDYPNSCLPSSISLKNLRVLHIESKNLKTLWQDESQAPFHLAELYIDAPISEVPKSIGKLKKLEKFSLSKGRFKTLPNEMGNLTGLQSLNLSGCFTLQKLPDRLGNLTGLQSLDLRRCSVLQALPDSVGNLTGLQSLDLRRCSTLQALPDSVGNLTGLQSLDLRWCLTLHTLPDRLGNLTGLQRLNLDWCSTLQALPDRLGNLTGLQRLELFECSNLQGLPDSVGNLTGLRSIDLTGCSTLQALPDSVGNLTGLQSLDLGECSTLQALPDSVGNLTGLQSLYLDRCSTLQALPDSMGNLTGLQSIYLDRCSTLQALPDSVGNLTGLQILDNRSKYLDNIGKVRELNQTHQSLVRELNRSLQSLYLDSSSSTLQALLCSSLHSSLQQLVDFGGLLALSESSCLQEAVVHLQEAMIHLQAVVVHLQAAVVQVQEVVVHLQEAVVHLQGLQAREWNW